MTPIVLIIMTGVLLLLLLGREAVRADSSRQAELLREGRHPLVLLVGSLLSLMALYSVVRHLPPEVSSSWSTPLHVGFICLWLVLMARRPPAKKGERT